MHHRRCHQPRASGSAPAARPLPCDPVRIFSDDDEAAILGLLEEGLKLLEQDYLGASGSRGYGQVRLEYTVA